MAPGSSRAVSARDFCELNSFYGAQIDARDRGDSEAWLRIFEPDALFATNVFDDSSARRIDDFAPAVRAVDQKFADSGIQRRHALSNFIVRDNGDGTVSVTHYGMLVATSNEGDTQLHSTSVVHDVLRRTRDGWRVVSREITRDDLAQLRHA